MQGEQYLQLQEVQELVVQAVALNEESYIILDVLDECDDREAIFDLLMEC